MECAPTAYNKRYTLRPLRAGSVSPHKHRIHGTLCVIYLKLDFMINGNYGMYIPYAHEHRQRQNSR